MSQKFDKTGLSTGRNSGPFLTLPENALACEGTRQLIEALPYTSQCLLYLSGPTGTGKTHLVRNFLREILKKNSGLKFRNLMASEYADFYAEAVDSKTIDLFLKQFEEIDLLILEDITSLQGRRETQRHLIFVVDLILKNGGKCLITSTKMPGELKQFNSKLVNRCHGGICLEIKQPGKKSREKLLEQMSSVLQIPIPAKGIERIACSKNVSPRELESTLVQMDAIARMNKKKIDLKFIDSFLSGEIQTPAPTLTQITRSVSKQLQVSVKNIRSTSRLKGHVFARQCAMFLMRELTETSLEKIASYFQRKNHSTVTHACQKIQSMEEENIAVNHQLKQIRNSLGIT